MPVKAQCPYCFAVFRVAREKIGLKAKCGKCGATFRLTAMADDRPDIGDAQVKAGFVEIRGPLGLPRWVVPALALAALFSGGVYLLYGVITDPGRPAQVGPSKEVSDLLLAARELVRQGRLNVAQAKYRDALALANRLGPAGEDVRGTIREELKAVKEDATRSVIITGVATVDDLDDPPDGPALDRGLRIIPVLGMHGVPECSARDHLVLVTCTIDLDKIDRQATFDGERVMMFKAAEFRGVDAVETRFRAVGFLVEGRYVNGRLILAPPLKGSGVFPIGVVFVVPPDGKLSRIYYKGQPSSRIR